MDQEKAADFVTKFYSENTSDGLLFHNLDRTKEVVAKTQKLIESYGKKNLDKDATLIAAWFMNIGFLQDYEKHIVKSSELVRVFCTENGAEMKVEEKLSKLIQRAWDTDEPEEEEVKILRDANTAYYGSDNFLELIELYRMERSHYMKDAPGLAAWREKYIERLRSRHQYYTKYAVDEWTEQKEKNMIKLVSKAKKAEKKKKKEKLKVKLKNQSPERAIQSLYRTQLRNHIKLSDIADTKANILLSVNAIIISLLLSNLIPTLDQPENSYLIYPTVIFVVFSIASMIMSVLATRPRINHEKLVATDLESEDTNYLFFGNFHSLELNQFKSKIKRILQNKETIYDALTMDLYFLGIVLQQKYKLLRRTYTIFIVGIVLSVIAFALAVKYFGMDDEIIDAVTPEPK